MRLKDKRIFLVEDNQNNAAIIQMLLEQDGAFVFRRRWDGEQSLDVLQALAPIDVILLDLMLPNKMTGYDICEAIRHLPKMENLPIVAVSASDPAVAIPKARTKGFTGFIAKPIDFSGFSNQIADILDGIAVWHIGRNMGL